MKINTVKKKSIRDFDTLLNDPEQDKRTKESVRYQYTDAEIEELFNQKPITKGGNEK